MEVLKPLGDEDRAAFPWLLRKPCDPFLQPALLTRSQTRRLLSTPHGFPNIEQAFLQIH